MCSASEARFWLNEAPMYLLVTIGLFVAGMIMVQLDVHPYIYYTGIMYALLAIIVQVKIISSLYYAYYPVK